MADRVTNPLVEQFQKGAIPRELRLMAAQGALPLGTSDLLELLQGLTTDADAEIAQTAVRTLTAMPAAELLPVFKDKQTPGSVLAWALTNRRESDLLEGVLQNTSTPDAAVQDAAPRLPASLAELVVINQVRLLRSTPLLVALESNPDLNNDQRRRLRELRETFRIGEQQPAPTPAPAPVAAPTPVVEAAPVEEPEAAPELVLAANTVETTGLSEQEAMVRYLAEDERSQTEKVSAVQKIYRLNTAEKVITALKGTREERAILIRDPNRIVCTAVLGSPRLTDAEVEAFAGMKNISDEILRKIGTHRDWTKKYTVVSSLVKNPRTPLGIALTLVPRLTPRDVKALTIDRNVPEVLRKHAKKFVKEAGGKNQ
jgi:hypothetical protein